MEPTTTVDVQSITPTMVARAYNGRAQACCCGCAGNYFDAGTPAAIRVLRRIQSVDNVEVFPGLDGETVVSADVDGRSLIVYVKV